MPGLKPGIFCLYILLLYYIWDILTKPHLTNIALLMKKILILIALTTFIISCSSDDSTPVNPEEKIVLLKKVILTNESGDTATYNYTYDGDKIVSMDGIDGSKIIYTYTGNLITHIKSTYSSSNSTLETTLEYNSNNQKISEIKLISAPGFKQGERKTYIYNQDGTVTFESYSGDLESQTIFVGTGKITFNESENTITQEGLSREPSKDVYDTKNYPMKNIRGYNEYIKPHFDENHNALTIDVTSANPAFIYTYTYNSDNYPITSIEKIYTVDHYRTLKKQFFYE